MLPTFCQVHGNSFFDSLRAYEAVWEQMPRSASSSFPANIKHHGVTICPSC